MHVPENCPVSVPLDREAVEIVRINLRMRAPWATRLLVEAARAGTTQELAAAQLGISRRTLGRWLDRHPELRKRMKPHLLTRQEIGANGAARAQQLRDEAEAREAG